MNGMAIDFRVMMHIDGIGAFLSDLLHRLEPVIITMVPVGPCIHGLEGCDQKPEIEMQCVSGLNVPGATGGDEQYGIGIGFR